MYWRRRHIKQGSVNPAMREVCATNRSASRRFFTEGWWLRLTFCAAFRHSGQASTKRSNPVRGCACASMHVSGSDIKGAAEASVMDDVSWHLSCLTSLSDWNPGVTTLLASKNHGLSGLFRGIWSASIQTQRFHRPSRKSVICSLVIISADVIVLCV